MKRILLMLVLLFALPLVSAQTESQIDVYESYFNTQGELIHTSTAVYDANLRGYVCNDISCSTLGIEYFPEQNSGRPLPQSSQKSWA